MDSLRRPPPHQRKWIGPFMPSRTRPPGSCLRELPHSATGRHNSWLILDRFVHRSKKLEGVVERDATASATCHDCVGRPVRASLRVAAAPAVSRLYLHLPGREWVEEIPLAEPMEEPSVIAAHRNSILFKVVVPFKDSEWTDPFLFPVDYFVYSASGSSSSPPSLTRLPACFEGVAPNPEDKYFHPYRRQRQRVMRVSQLGLLCRGDEFESFTVAHLKPRSYREVELCFLHHHAPPPGAVGTAMPSWKVKRLQITPQMRMTGLNLASFTTDAVLAVSPWELCWVDYYQGMLLINFQPTGRDQQLTFIPLPSEVLRSRRPYIDPGTPDPFRRVSITSGGFINLVCITKSRVHCDSHLDFTIETWILDIARPRWRKDFGAAMKHDEFYSLYEASQNIPRVIPSFPVISLVDPDVISFLLKEDDDVFWMIEVNMWHKKLQSSAVYIREEEEEEESEGGEEGQVGGGGEEKAAGGKEEQLGGGEGDEGYFSNKKVCRIFFDGHYFIPSQFSAYLSEDAITSWELSDMMQRKVKQRMARQKSCLEAPSGQVAGLKIVWLLFLLCIVCFFVGPSGFPPF